VPENVELQLQLPPPRLVQIRRVIPQLPLQPPRLPGTGTHSHLTTAAFKKRLQGNGVKLPPFAWSVQDFRDLNRCMTGVISSSR
jgi:hypothetical protein